MNQESFEKYLDQMDEMNNSGKFLLNLVIFLKVKNVMNNFRKTNYN